MKRIACLVMTMIAAVFAAWGKELAPAPSDSGLVLNFHDVPLNAVANYLSEKAGLIVVSDVNLNGRVNLVSELPLGTNELLDILSSQLAKNNFAVTLTGRTLTIMNADDARTSATTRVMATHSQPSEIPMSDQIVTAIMPVNTLSAGALVKDLQPLMGRNVTMTANESGNAILMTASLKEIHRVAEIISGLDSSSLSEVEVFVLKCSDAKTLASELKDVFQTTDSSASNANDRNNFGGPFGGPGGPGGGPFGGQQQQSASATKNSNTHISFVADDQMNAIVASAPPTTMTLVKSLVAKLDLPTSGVTEMRVMRLKNADPGEVVDEITALFPSSDTTSQSDRSAGFQFGGMQQAGGNNGSSSKQSTRMQKQLAVSAVVDRRIQSVIISASHAMMEQVQNLVRDLDEGKQGVQSIGVFDLHSVDSFTAQESMTSFFASSSGAKSSTSSSTSTSPLQARYTANLNSQSTSASSSSSMSKAGGGGSSTP